MLDITHAESRIAVIRLSRPPVNAINLELLAGLTEALEDAESNARGIVLTGSETVFSAGIDLKDIGRYDRDQRLETVRRINALVIAAIASPLPIVAAITGHALGGGLVIPLCCDWRLATTRPCKLGLNEINAGVPFPAAAIEAVRQTLDPAVARRLVLSGDPLTPQQALAQGVVDGLCDDPVAAAIDRCRKLASVPDPARFKAQWWGPALTSIRAAAADDPMIHSWL